MSSDYEYSDEDVDYYDDEDEDMLSAQEDGECRGIPPSGGEPHEIATRSLDSRCLVSGSDPSDEEMEMDAFGDDFNVPQRAVRKAYEVEHESLPQSAVEKLMAADVEHISGIFGVDVCGLLSPTLYHLYPPLPGKHRFVAFALHELEQGAPDREIHGQCLGCVCFSGNIPSIEGVSCLVRRARTFSGNLVECSVRCTPQTHAANTRYALPHIHRVSGQH